MNVKLIRVGDFETREYPIEVDVFTIGRDHTCNLRLDHGRVSRSHCRVHVRGDRVLVEALYSAAGTAVNQRILDPNGPPVEVDNGDHLWVGTEHFQFVIGSEMSAFDGVATNPLLKGAGEHPNRAANQPPPPPRPSAPTARAQAPVPLDPDEGEEPEEAEEATPVGIFVVTRTDGVAVVRLLQKEIVSECDIRAITEELGGLIDSGENCITLHLGNVERLTSEVLGEVFQVSRRCKAEGGMLKICKVSPQVAGVFKMTNMQRHIEIFPDETLALKSLWPRQAPGAPPGAVAAPARPSPSPTCPVRLLVEVGRAKGRAVEINVPRFLIGRGEQCQLRPNSEGTSRLHAAIEQRAGRVFVRDLGSQAGTVLNGRVLHDEEAEASHGDRLQVDALQFTFAIETRAASPPPFDPSEALGVLFGGPSTDPSAATAMMALPDFAPVSPSPPLTRNRPRRPSRLTYEVVSGVNVVTLMTPDLSDESNISAVRSELEAIPVHPVRERRVIRFDRVETFSKGAVVMFLARAQCLARDQGRLRFCNVSPSIRSFLEETQLPQVVEIYPTLAEAMAAPWAEVEAGVMVARTVPI